MQGGMISVILPTFNERENVVEMHRRLKEVIDPTGMDYEILFVDDNSPDGTIEEVKNLMKSDSRVKYVLMSTRFGDQSSLMAGLDYAEGNVVITMDADLQHPPERISEMLEKWKDGFDIVIMKRQDSLQGGLLKKWSEVAFYRILARLSKTPIHYRFSGFALIDRKVVLALRRYREADPFFRGLVGLVGFNKTELHYLEGERKYGRTKYRFLEMLRLATSGVTSFSDMPLYLSFYMGLIAVAVSLLYSIYVICSTLFFGSVVPGWASLVLTVIFIGGTQLVSIGILGIYISKIFIASKGRPRYIVAETGGIEAGTRALE